MMRIIKKILNKIDEWFRVCEFKKKCPYFDEESRVCMGGGGNYCGQYREFLKVKKQSKKFRKCLRKS